MTEDCRDACQESTQLGLLAQRPTSTGIIDLRPEEKFACILESVPAAQALTVNRIAFERSGSEAIGRILLCGDRSPMQGGARYISLTQVRKTGCLPTA